MGNPEFKPTSLATLDNGAAIELFDHELARVMANIDDINTDARVTRKITLEVTLKPEADRETIIAAVSVRSKMAGLKPATAILYGVRENGKLKPYSRDVRQEQMFDEKKVIPITKAAHAGESHD